MAKKAILRVRNSNDYIDRPTPNPGGEKKDFLMEMIKHSLHISHH